MTLRIIAGERRGTHLAAPSGLETRPTLGRVRESLFMILQHDLPEARVLDAFAGSGALGLEAISRGASHATFIEQGRPALDALAANIRKLGWEDRTRVLTREALTLFRQPQPPDRDPYDLIFLDPPYGKDLCARSIELLAGHLDAWLTADGIIVAQHGRRDPLAPEYAPLLRTREESYAETRVSFYRRRAEAAVGEPFTS